jgi:glycosyltransferase involved in cell wall biosynthesis
MVSPDIVHTTEHVSSPSFWCNFLKADWKTVLLERAGEWDGIVPKFGLHGYLARKFIFPNVDAFAALSSYAEENLRKLGCEKEITVIPNPVDTVLFNVKIPWHERKNIVLYVGRLIKLKKIEFIISAIMKVREKIPDAELWIIGDGEDRKYYEAIAAGKEFIKFLGAQSRRELPQLYNKAKALVMLTDRRNTGLTMAVQEAIACGVPIVGSEGLPFDETRLPYYYISSLNPASVADKLILCISEGEKKSINARIVAEKTYSHEAIGYAYKQMIEKIK